jgi:ABC-2 type transport system ATP-binding protein
MMIHVERARRRFGKLLALDDVSLQICAGERVALVGTNGSGKTTLLRALCGVLQVEGRVEVLGHDMRREPELALAGLSYLPQIAPPLDAPSAELVRAYCTLRGLDQERVRVCAARLGLSLQEVARTRMRDLSGGMKQKLLAALALSSTAPILICDEPTASLDREARAEFFALVRERPRDSVLVLCSHRLEEVSELVGRVVELKDGRIVHDQRAAQPGNPEPRPAEVTQLRPLQGAGLTTRSSHA